MADLIKVGDYVELLKDLKHPSEVMGEVRIVKYLDPKKGLIGLSHPVEGVVYYHTRIIAWLKVLVTEAEMKDLTKGE